MTYSIVHYTDFGFSEEVVATTPNYTSTRNICNMYGGEEDWESGYYVKDEHDCIVRD